MPRPLPPIDTRLHGVRRKPAGSVVTGTIVDDASFPEGRAIEIDGQRFRMLSVFRALN